MYLSSDQVIETLVGFLKRDPGFSFKSKPSNALQIFAANILLSILRDMTSWPISLIKVFVEDSLAERIWVDTMEVKGLVDNILTGFRTFIPTKSFLNPDVAAIKGEAPNSPNIHNDDSSDSKIDSMSTEQRLEDVTVSRRFTPEQEEQISTYIKDIVNEQLTRKPASEISRNLLRLLMATVGVQSIRFLIAQKLEVWLQNPKVQKPAQDLSRILILNLTESDGEVVGIVIKSLQKIRSKPIVNHFVSCVKELILMKEEMTDCFIREAVVSFMNEVVTASRGSNNMQLICTILTSGSSEKSTRILASLFQELMMKEDCLKTLRILVREVVRTLRYDHLSLTLFVSTLVRENRSFLQINLNDPMVRERTFHSTIDLITLTMFLCVSPSVKEAASAPRSDRKDVMRNFQIQIADITRSGILWFQFTAMKLTPDRNEFMHGLNKLLLMEGFEQYCNRDNWPPESERNLIFRLCSEVPFLEDTLASILNMALTRSYPISPTEAIEVADCLIKRAAACYDEGNGSSVLEMRNEEIFHLLLNCSTYRMPDNIALPVGYEPPTLAVSDWYWKVWVQLLILTAHNTKTFGHKAWQSFPTLSLIIEMAITSHFEFPPPTQPCEEIRIRDSQLSTLEKQQILQFETHLAAASTKMLITESTSLLMSKLITFDPMGVARKPPSNILEQLKLFNTSFKLGHLLCQSRNPDFLLEIIQRQQRSKTQRQVDSGGPVSMPWLNQLVELHEDNFSALPVQCLCEFLLGQIYEDVVNKNGTTNGTTNGIHSSGKNNTSGGTKGESGTADKLKEKEKRRKLKKLIVFFKNMLLNEAEMMRDVSERKDGSEKMEEKEERIASGRVAREMIDYFMKRLGCQQSLFRSLASKALDVIMTPTVTIQSSNGTSCETQDVSFDSIFQSNSSCNSNHHDENNSCLFLEMLPKTKGFESVKQVACDALRWSLLVETDPHSLTKYLQFLSQHCLHSDSEIALNLAHLLIERQIVTRVIVSRDDELKRSFLSSSHNILYNYLHANLMKDPLQDWPSSVVQQVEGDPSSSSSSHQQCERVLVLWQTTGQTIVIHVSIIHAIVMLLIYGPVQGCEQIYDHQMVRWFGHSHTTTSSKHSFTGSSKDSSTVSSKDSFTASSKDSFTASSKDSTSGLQLPSVYSLETREEEPLLPESLKLFLLKSRNEILVNAGLVDLDTRSLVLFIQSFGIPIVSMDKLLQLLDERCQLAEEKAILKSNIPDESFMKHLIQVQWMRGARNGKQFALFLGLNPEPTLSSFPSSFPSSSSQDLGDEEDVTKLRRGRKGIAADEKTDTKKEDGKKKSESSKKTSGKKTEMKSGGGKKGSERSIVPSSSSRSEETSLLLSPSKVSRLFAELVKKPCLVFRIDDDEKNDDEEEDERVKEKHLFQPLFRKQGRSSAQKISS